MKYEFIDFNDESIPVGKRKVAYVKWAMSKGTPEKLARTWANRKFGWERRGKWLVFIGNCEDLHLHQFRGYTWEEACCVNINMAESVIVWPDDRPCFELVPCRDACNLSQPFFDRVQAGIIKTFGQAEEWAKEHGYKTKKTWITA